MDQRLTHELAVGRVVVQMKDAQWRCRDARRIFGGLRIHDHEVARRP